MPVILLLYIDFIDGFSIFRNLYRILIGYYFIPVGLLIDECIKPGSIFPILFRLYGSNFGNIINALKLLAKLNKGIIIDILRKLPNGGIKAKLYIFPLYYIGDIP